MIREISAAEENTHIIFTKRIISGHPVYNVTSRTQPTFITKKSSSMLARRLSWQPVRNSSYLSFGRVRSVTQPTVVLSSVIWPFVTLCICVSPRFIPLTTPDLLPFSLFRHAPSFPRARLLLLFLLDIRSLLSFNNISSSRVRPRRRPLYTDLYLR